MGSVGCSQTHPHKKLAKHSYLPQAVVLWYSVPRWSDCIKFFSPAFVGSVGCSQIHTHKKLAPYRKLTKHSYLTKKVILWYYGTLSGVKVTAYFFTGTEKAFITALTTFFQNFVNES